jgi:peptide/nickel transport system substrate-binding protein
MMAGLIHGPFRVKEYVPNQYVLLERKPYYWRFNNSRRRFQFSKRSPLSFVGSENAQSFRFLSGETHVLTGFRPDEYEALERRQGVRIFDLGPGLEYTFFLLSLNALGPEHITSVRGSQQRFRQTVFRQAISHAVYRKAMVRLVYRGMASSLWIHVSSGPWVSRSIARTTEELFFRRPGPPQP